MNDYGDLGMMIRQLRTEIEWAVRTGIVPPEVEPPEVTASSARPEPALQIEERFDAQEEPPLEEEPPLAEAPLFKRPTPSAHVPPIDPARKEGAKAPTSGQKASDVPKKLPVVNAILEKCSSLDEVREVLGDCKRCKLGGLGRRQVVFGVGNPAADIMFVGEGPGADEDLQGEPFVGKAGQLLTAIIEGGMGMRRADVYIANVVKCRPPQNRDPEPDEIQTCRPFLEAQIRLVAPKVIVTLGRFAAQTLLNTSTGMMRLRGKWQEYNGLPVMPTFHPAYLLRNPAEKRATWQDIQEVLRFTGRPIPKRGS